MRGQVASIHELGAPEVWASPRERLTDRAAGEVETALIGRILWRRRKQIALATIAATLATLVYLSVATPQHTALVQILVDPRDKQVVSNDVNPSSIAADGGVTQVESQGSVLLSDSVLQRAVAATHLEEDPEFNGDGLVSHALHLVTALRRRPDPEQAAQDRMAETLLTLHKHAAYRRAEKVLVLDLTVRANNPDKAALIANAIADAYLADQADARAKAGREASTELASRLGELQTKVQEAENAVEGYRAEKNFVVSTGQLVSDQEINQTTAQLTAADNRVASLKAQLDQLRSDPGAQGTPEAMNSGVMVRLRDRESAIVEKLSSESKQLGPRHPEIASLQQSLADVRGLIAKETQRLRQAAEADYQRAVEDQRSIAKKLDGMKSKSLEDDRADIHMRELQRQADAARAVYQAFLTRARETMEAANVDTTNARVITRALRPQQKSWPPTLLLLLGAAFGGLTLGASGSLAHEYLRPSVLTAAQARDVVDAPVLGVIPARELYASPAIRSARGLDAVGRMLLRKLGDHAATEEPKLGRCIYLVSGPSAALARARVAEGLAAFAVRAERDVLLVDGDLAGDGASGRPGLADVLRADKSIGDVAYSNEGERYSRLDKGGPDPDGWTPRENTDAFRLKRVRRCYDLVVLDGGSMTDNPRLAALAAETDLVLLVAEIGEPQAELATEVECAALAEAKFDAVVLVAPSGEA